MARRSKFTPWQEVARGIAVEETTAETVFNFIELFCHLNYNGPILSEIQAAVDYLYDKKQTKTSTSHLTKIINELEADGRILTDRKKQHRIPGRILILETNGIDEGMTCGEETS